MSEKIVQSATGITIIGGAKIKTRQIGQAMALAPVLIAADSGAKTALRAGLMPDAVIGDMDSAADGVLDDIPKDRIHRIAEQDTTDFEKCLYSLRAPFVIALGVIGSRLDHSLSSLNALTRFADLPVLLVSKKDVIFLCPPSLSLDLPVGTRVSLFPLAPVQGSSAGLEWPIEGLQFSPFGRIGTSNRSTGHRVELSFDAPHMLVILPVKYLEAALTALARP